MVLVTENEMEKIENAIAAVEKETDAELVVVLAGKSDSYLYIPTLWAGICALLAPLFLKFTPLWMDGDDLLLVQWLTFIVLAVFFRIPAIMMRLVSKKVKHWRASNLARRQFLENNLHHTVGETGVLIFISEAEHYIEVVADRGIDKYVSQEKWQGIVDDMVAKIKQRKTFEAVVNCVEECGQLLKEHAPSTSEKNELPNRLIVL